MTQRSTARDGRGNRLEFKLLTHFPWLWHAVQRSRFWERRVNRFLINRAVSKIKARPHALSTMSSYTSWDSLTDRTFSGRHLSPADEKYIDSLPPINDVAEIFRRPPGGARLSGKSTFLFCYFAQWFTDGFLRTERNDWRKTTSNHDIDLSPLYGLNRKTTDLIRAKEGGRLKSQVINGEEYAPFLFDENGEKKAEFAELPIVGIADLPAERRRWLFAMGGDRANSQTGYVMLNTLFLREHNRICGVLQQAYPSWDDERLFQTARNVLIVLLLRIVIEEYINHITPYYFKFRVDPLGLCNPPWYRTNWMTVEFNLLYRWHSLVTDTVRYAGRDLPTEETFFNNQLVIDRGLGLMFEDASQQPAGEIGVFNTPDFLMETERASLKLGRQTKLRSYNDYRVMCGYPRVTDFDQISARPEVQAKLKALYGHVDRIELYTGLFAEDVRPRSVLAALTGRMVGNDAFSQALTNPLLCAQVYNEKTFAPEGLKIIQETNSLSQIVHRNVPDAGQRFVSLTQPGAAV
jgi:prostaglandin-endoperoxide synthase 2